MNRFVQPAPPSPKASGKGKKRIGKRNVGSIQQQYLPIREVRGPILCLDDRERPDERLYRMILEVTGVNYALLSVEEQECIFVNFQQLQSSLAFPTQMITRVSPLNVETYIQYIEANAHDGSEEEGGYGHLWRDLAQNHIDWLRETTQNATLLERKFYIVIPANDRSLSSGFFSSVFYRSKRGEEELLTFTQAAQQLQLRAEFLAMHLESMGLHVDQVQGAALVSLYDEMIGGAQRARQYPLKEEMLLMGSETSSLDDVLAPASIRVEPSYLVVDEQEYLRGFAIRGLPRSVLPGFLYRLVQSQEILDIVMHQIPHKQHEAVHLLKRKQSQYESSVVFADTQGRRVDPAVRMAASDVGPLLDALVAGDEQLHDFALHVLLRAGSRAALEKATKRVEELVYTLCHSRLQPLLYEQELAFRLCLPGNFIFRDTMILDSSSVASLYPFFSNLLYRPGEDSVLVGITPDREPIVVNLFELSNYNWYVLGPSGSGKSFSIKTICERIFVTYQAKTERERKHQEAKRKAMNFQLFVIDPEREWQPLSHALGGQWVRLSPGSSYHINPFDLPQPRETQREEDESILKEDLLANQVQLLHHMLDAMLASRSVDNEHEATLSVQEKALLDAALYECYRKVGITPDRATHSRKPPLLRDLYHILEAGDVGQDTTGLAPRLKRFVSGSLSGLFSGHTNVDLNNTMVCFDVKELDGELRPIGLMMVATLVWNMSYASLIPRWLVIDELATLCRYRSGELFAREMFRRFRKMYGGVIGITQDPHTNPDIMNNCAIHLILRQSHATVSQVAELFKLSPQEERYVATCQRGQGLVLVDGKRMAANFIASPLEYRLATTDPRELAQFEQERREQARGKQGMGQQTERELTVAEFKAKHE